MDKPTSEYNGHELAKAVPPKTTATIVKTIPVIELIAMVLDTNNPTIINAITRRIIRSILPTFFFMNLDFLDEEKMNN